MYYAKRRIDVQQLQNLKTVRVSKTKLYRKAKLYFNKSVAREDKTETNPS